MSYPRTLDYYCIEEPCKKEGFVTITKAFVATFGDGSTCVRYLTDNYEADMLYFHQDLVKGIEKARTTGGLIKCDSVNAGWRMTKDQWEKDSELSYGI
jgi:hypothetical protein